MPNPIMGSGEVLPDAPTPEERDINPFAEEEEILEPEYVTAGEEFGPAYLPKKPKITAETEFEKSVLLAARVKTFESKQQHKEIKRIEIAMNLAGAREDGDPLPFHPEWTKAILKWAAEKNFRMRVIGINAIISAINNTDNFNKWVLIRNNNRIKGGKKNGGSSNTSGNRERYSVRLDPRRYKTS
jgi:hypothetical protein